MTRRKVQATLLNIPNRALTLFHKYQNMDYARKIGKSDEPKRWIKSRPRFVTVRDEPICPDTVFIEDHRLKNWKEWLATRRDQHKRIKSKTNRPQTEFVMNACETIRPLIETRNIMDYATVPIPTIPDKYRGGPEFWKRLPKIPKQNPCLPDITFAPSKKDLNEAPELTFVGLPELIEEEKDLTCLSSKTPSWKRNQYLKKRKEQLSEEIKLLVPKEPRTKHLIVKNFIPPKTKNLPRIPPITVSDGEDEEHSCDQPDQVAVLKIQDTEIWQTFSSKNKQTNSEPIKWNLKFCSNVNRMEEKEIVFENKGNRVILYQWREARFQSKTMHPKRRISPFFFNKTKGAILPGQFARLKVWYRSRTPGIFLECWRLITDPEFRPSMLIFRFWGHSETMAEVEKAREEMVDKYLDRCIRNSVIREIVEDIIEDVDSVKLPDPAYGTLFLESEIFTAKNPLCFYSPSLLIEFQKLYYIATNQKQQRWNLSINDLRDILLTIKYPERRYSMLKQLNELYKECLKPTLYKPVYSNKHEVVCNLLCNFFNRFEIESQLSGRIRFGEKQESKTHCAMENMSETFVNDAHCDIPSIGEGDPLQKDFVITNDIVYRETFFIRIYQLLGETIEQIFTAIESFDSLSQSDK